MILTSTGLRNYMLATGSARAALAAGFVKIFSGTPPATADAAETGTLLCTISINSSGTGVNLATSAAAGIIQKSGSEVWSGVNGATGAAGYFRHVGAADTGAISTTEPRVQGTVGTVGTDMELNSTSLVAAATQTLDYYSLNLPTV
ncbi:MAG: hypothetical protein AAB131_18095 [Actinomycetota bacterium]